jgi:hypothetical protein
VAESYILLSPQELLSDNIRFRLLVSFETLLTSTTRQRIGVIPHLVEMLIRGVEFVDGGSEQAYSVFAKSLLDSSFLPSLLSGLREAYDSHLTTGPNKKSAGVYGVVETDYLSVLARLALANPKIFISAVTASAEPETEEQALTWILTEWFSHFDNMGDISRKKLHALALTHLLSVNGAESPPPTYLLNHLQSYLTVWTDLITELAEGTDYAPDDPRHGDYLIFWPDRSNESNMDGKYHESEPPETTRRRAWSYSDPLHRINIRDFVTDNLQRLVGVCGGVDLFRDRWLVNVDHDIVKGFGQLGLL